MVVGRGHQCNTAACRQPPPSLQLLGRHCSLPTAAVTILHTTDRGHHCNTAVCWQPPPSLQLVGSHCSLPTAAAAMLTTATTNGCRPPPHPPLQLADSRRHYSPSISVANIANRQPPPLLQVQFPPLFGSASAGGIDLLLRTSSFQQLVWWYFGNKQGAFALLRLF